LNDHAPDPSIAMNDSGVEARIALSLREFAPEIEAPLREARQRLRAMFPTGFELVFDNYNALVFAISPTERTGDAFISLASYPRWITLFFLHGAALRDPAGLLEGRGKQVRSIRLGAPAQLDTPEVRALVAQAVLPHRASLLAAPALATLIKSVVASRRSRRPAAAAAAPRRRRSTAPATPAER
jgi:hypothetical protein